jgi:hypothetical protein
VGGERSVNLSFRAKWSCKIRQSISVVLFSIKLRIRISDVPSHDPSRDVWRRPELRDIESSTEERLYRHLNISTLQTFIVGHKIQEVTKENFPIPSAPKQVL